MQFQQLTRSRIAAVISAASLLSLPALADYVVNVVDYRDPVTNQVAAFTFVWGLNDNGQLVGQASMNDPSGATGQFNFVYDPASGKYLTVPPPPGADPDTTFTGVGAINNSGVITGTFTDATGLQQAFLLSGGAPSGTTWSGGTYRFFSYPGGAGTQGRSIGNPTPAYPQGLAVANGFTAGGLVLDASRPFVYDPATGAIADLPLPHSYLTTASGINKAGQVAGSVRYQNNSGAPLANGNWAFLFTPTTGSDPLQGGTVAYFRITPNTRARGINDSGLIAVGAFDGYFRTYVGTSAGYQEIVMPGVIDPNCTSSTPQGINNSGQLAGPYTDASCKQHGFIATPASLPTGTTSNGAYTFNVDVVANTPIFIDPPVALGYEYKTGRGDPPFAAVRLPLGIGDGMYRIAVGDDRSWRVNAGELFDFRQHGHPAGVKSFEVRCIDPRAMLDPANSRAFPTQLTFVSSGKFTGTQRPRPRNIPAANLASQVSRHDECLAGDDGDD